MIVFSMALGKCRGCQSEIESSHITATQNIPKTPQFLALSYKCSNCGKKDKLVIEEQAWTALTAKAAVRGRKRKRDARIIEVELSGIHSAQDLINLWAAQKSPPLIEELRGLCGCPTCKKKWSKDA